MSTLDAPTAPQFVHDCDRCRFYGHLLGQDVYVCPDGALGPSLVARHGDDGPAYGSSPLSLFLDQLTSNGWISGTANGEPWRLRFRDYLVSPHAIPCHRAWLVVVGLLLAEEKALAPP